MKKDFYIYKCLREIHRLNQSLLLEMNRQGILLILNTPGSLEHFMVHTDPGKLKSIFDTLFNHILLGIEKGSIEFGFMLGRDEQMSFYVKKSPSTSLVQSKRREEMDSEVTLVDGLSKILSDMGGRIWIDRISETCQVFWFTVDILPPESGTHGQRVKNEKLIYPDWSKRTILIVDDVQTNLLLLENFLVPTNARIIGVDNGLKAFNAVKKERSIEFVLMDVRMPVLDGYEATRRIKNLKPWLPVVALSAYPESAETVKWKRAGCDAFLGKPLNPKDLINNMILLFENVSMKA